MINYCSRIQNILIFVLKCKIYIFERLKTNAVIDLNYNNLFSLNQISVSLSLTVMFFYDIGAYGS